MHRRKRTHCMFCLHIFMYDVVLYRLIQMKHGENAMKHTVKHIYRFNLHVDKYSIHSKLHAPFNRSIALT